MRAPAGRSDPPSLRGAGAADLLPWEIHPGSVPVSAPQLEMSQEYSSAQRFAHHRRSERTVMLLWLSLARKAIALYICSRTGNAPRVRKELEGNRSD